MTASLEAFAQALRAAERLGDKKMQRDCLAWLGENHRQLGELAKAISYLDRSLAMFEGSDNEDEARVLSELSLNHTYAGNIAAAKDAAERARALAETSGSDVLVALALDAKSLVLLVTQDFEGARSHAHKAASIYRRADLTTAAFVVNVEGLANLGLERNLEARIGFQEARDLGRRTYGQRITGMATINLAHLEWLENRPEEARRLAEEAVAIFDEIGTGERKAAHALRDLVACPPQDSECLVTCLLRCARESASNPDLFPASQLAAQAVQVASASGLSQLLSEAESFAARFLADSG